LVGMLENGEQRDTERQPVTALHDLCFSAHDLRQKAVQDLRSEVIVRVGGRPRVKNALEQPYRRNWPQQGAVEVCGPFNLQPGESSDPRERASSVAPTVLMGVVVVRPQRFVGGNGRNDDPVGREDPLERRQRPEIVMRVLDHVQTRDEFERAVWPREILNRAVANIVVASRARRGNGVGVEIYTGKPTPRTKHVQGASGSTPGVKDTTLTDGRQHRLKDCSASGEPPVIVVDRQHPLNRLAVHTTSLIVEER